MAEFVLDASVALSWCFPGDPTEDTPYSRLILAKLARTLADFTGNPAVEAG